MIPDPNGIDGGGNARGLIPANAVSDGSDLPQFSYLFGYLPRRLALKYRIRFRELDDDDRAGLIAIGVRDYSDFVAKVNNPDAA